MRRPLAYRHIGTIDPASSRPRKMFAVRHWRSVLRIRESQRPPMHQEWGRAPRRLQKQSQEPTPDDRGCRRVPYRSPRQRRPRSSPSGSFIAKGTCDDADGAFRVCRNWPRASRVSRSSKQATRDRRNLRYATTTVVEARTQQLPPSRQPPC